MPRASCWAVWQAPEASDHGRNLLPSPSLSPSPGDDLLLSLLLLLEREPLLLLSVRERSFSLSPLRSPLSARLASESLTADTDLAFSSLTLSRQSLCSRRPFLELRLTVASSGSDSAFTGVFSTRLDFLDLDLFGFLSLCPFSFFFFAGLSSASS